MDWDQYWVSVLDRQGQPLFFAYQHPLEKLLKKQGAAKY